jgi:SAM-dependent methyltransferase
VERVTAPTLLDLALLTEDGRELRWNIARWLGEADAGDETVLARCVGPVLDVGCGPGRFVRALAERSIACLGIDITETAVGLTRNLGGPALLRSVFGPVPGQGRWPTVLLMDGSIGGAGHPQRLLARAAQLLAAAGRVIVELDPDPRAERICVVRFVALGRPLGAPFDWAEVGLDALCGYAGPAGLRVGESWSADGRTFATLLSR